MKRTYKKNDIIKINNDEYKVIKIYETGANGCCYLVFNNGFYYILKDYSNVYNAKEKITHEAKMCRKINNSSGKNTNTKYLFKSEALSSEDNKEIFLKIETEYGKVFSDEEIILKCNDLKYAIELILKTIEAVNNALHSAEDPVLHLDIKPDNLYDSDDRVRLLDLGCSYSISELNNMAKNLEEGFKGFPLCTGTYGYRSALLSDLFHSIEEENISRVKTLLEKVSVKDDIYSIAYTFLFLITGCTLDKLWERKAEYRKLNKHNLIRNALIDNNINPLYYDEILKIFDKVEVGEYEKLVDDNGSLQSDFTKLKEIVDGQGFHDEVIIKKSEEVFVTNHNARGFTIDEQILPFIGSEKKTVSDVVFDMIDSSEKSLKKNIFFAGSFGGMGKTISFWKLWQDALGFSFDIKKGKYVTKSKNVRNKYVPIYVPLRLLKRGEYGLFEYILNNYTGLLDQQEDYSKYYNNFLALIKSSSKKYIFILDGLNEVMNKEIKENLQKDVVSVSEIENCYVIISSRGFDDNYSSFSECTIEKLTKDQITSYCIEKTDIKEQYEIESKLEILSSPMLLTLFVESYSSLSYEEIGDLKFNSEGELIKAFFKSQKNKSIPEYSKLMIDYVLPLFALEQLKEGNPAAVLPYKQKNEFLKKVYDFICGEELLLLEMQDSIKSDNLMKNSITDMFDYRNFIKFADWFKKIIAQTNHILYEEKDSYVYYHENFRDYFIARGLVIMSNYSPDNYNKIIERVIHSEMRYNSDTYSSRISSMGRYRYLFNFKEELNEKELDEKTVLLFSNLVFTYEEIQEYNNECLELITYVFDLIKKKKYIRDYKYYENYLSQKQLLETEVKSIADKMNIVSGLIYTMQQLPSKIKKERIIKKVGFERKEKVYKFCLNKLKEARTVLELLLKHNPRDLHCSMILARLNGNLGAHFLAIRDNENVNKENAIKMALRYHEEGYRIRQKIKKDYNTTMSEKDKIELAKGFGMSYTCFATDYYHLSTLKKGNKKVQNLEKSIKFHRKALKVRIQYDQTRAGENMLGIAGNTLDIINEKKGNIKRIRKTLIECIELLEGAVDNIRNNKRKREVEKLVDTIYGRLAVTFENDSLEGGLKNNLIERCAKLADDSIELFNELKPFDKEKYKKGELFKS